MCGRYASTKGPEGLAAEFGGFDATGEDAPGADYNIAPTKDVLSVVQRHPRDGSGRPDPSTTERSVRAMRWGLVPKWAEDPSIGTRMINAKSETVATKPAFRNAVRYYRCLLPADGWYEWKRDGGTKPGGTKQPYFVTRGDGSSLALAGIWATWRDPHAGPGALPLVSCSVITTDAAGPLAEVHERMPLMLPERVWSRWLDPDLEDVSDVLGSSFPDLVGELELRPVSRAVNSVRNNRPELLERIDPAPPAEQAALFES